MTAALRSPEKLTERHERLTVVRADALDAESVKAVVDGADAVLSGIGQAGRHDPLRPASTSARALVEAMTATGVRRLLVVSAAPLNRAGTGQSFLTRRLFGPLLWAALKELYSDLERMESVLRGSALDWTAVRPPRLTDKPGEGRCRHDVEAGPAAVSSAAPTWPAPCSTSSTIRRPTAMRSASAAEAARTAACPAARTGAWPGHRPGCPAGMPARTPPGGRPGRGPGRPSGPATPPPRHSGPHPATTPRTSSTSSAAVATERCNSASSRPRPPSRAVARAPKPGGVSGIAVAAASAPFSLRHQTR